jgi:protein TonB
LKNAEIFGENSPEIRGALPGLASGYGNSWLISAGVHALISALVLWMMVEKSSRSKKSEVDIQVIEAPKVAPRPVQVSQAPPQVPKKNRPREVFGLSRKSLNADAGVEVKAGNTVAKAPDQEKLKPGDEDSLPVPSEEYLITRMPQLKAEVRIPYPAEPRKKGIQGAVIMDLLIDATGRVRDVQLVEGPDPELSQAAVTAVRDFQFLPALIDDKAVAVRIRYAYRFVLER